MQKPTQSITRYTQQRGFTLIELMIVVAIIGVLASIAVPQYQNYTARAQASEGLTVTAGLRADIAEYFSLNGEMPTTHDQIGYGDHSATDLGMTGRYVGTVGYAGDTITITFDDTASAFDDDANAMTLQPVEENNTRSPQNGWECAPAGANGIPENRLPAGCRAD
nr:pilin [uncultured Halomonas sp.]